MTNFIYTTEQLPSAMSHLSIFVHLRPIERYWARNFHLRLCCQATLPICEACRPRIQCYRVLRSAMISRSENWGETKWKHCGRLRKTMIVPSEGIIVIVTSKTQIFSSIKPVILSNFVRSEQGKETKVCSVVLCYREFWIVTAWQLIL